MISWVNCSLVFLSSRQRFTLSFSVMAPVSYVPSGMITFPPPFSETWSMAFWMAAVSSSSSSATAPKSNTFTVKSGNSGSFIWVSISSAISQVMPPSPPSSPLSSACASVWFSVSIVVPAAVVDGAAGCVSAVSWLPPHAVSPMANAAAREIPHNFFFMTLAPLVYSVHPFIRRAFLI